MGGLWRKSIFGLVMIGLCLSCTAISYAEKVEYISVPLSPELFPVLRSVADSSDSTLGLHLNEILSTHYMVQEYEPLARYYLLVAGLGYLKDENFKKTEQLLRRSRLFANTKSPVKTTIEITDKLLEAELVIASGEVSRGLELYWDIELKYGGQKEMWTPRFRLCELYMQFDEPSKCLSWLSQWNLNSISRDQKLIVVKVFYEARIVMRILSKCTYTDNKNWITINKEFLSSIKDKKILELLSLDALICKSDGKRGMW